MPASEKDKFLTMVTESEGAQVEALLVRRFRQESRPTGATVASGARRAAEQAARHLKQLAGRKDETWQQVEKLTMFSKPTWEGRSAPWSSCRMT
jgi:hypothetical protein